MAPRTLNANNAPLLLVLMGGGIANIVACLTLNVSNQTASNYLDRSTPLVSNYIFCAIAGIVAYAEFIFFGMGETQMGRFSVLASWPIHMAFIILFSNMWGILLDEWKGTSRRTWILLTIGLVALVASTLISSYGSWLKENQATLS